MEYFKVVDNKEFVAFLRTKLKRNSRRFFRLSFPLLGKNRGKAVFPKSFYLTLVNLFLAYGKVNGKLEVKKVS